MLQICFWLCKLHSFYPSCFTSIPSPMCLLYGLPPTTLLVLLLHSLFTSSCLSSSFSVVRLIRSNLLLKSFLCFLLLLNCSWASWSCSVHKSIVLLIRENVHAMDVYLDENIRLFFFSHTCQINAAITVPLHLFLQYFYMFFISNISILQSYVVFFSFIIVYKTSLSVHSINKWLVFSPSL